MLWHLVGVVTAGLGCAGIALLLRTLTRNRLPRWMIPVYAGIGMLAYQIYGEYNWFAHKQTQLPAGSVVIESEAGTVFWRPWTQFYPMTTAFSMVELDQVSRTLIDHAEIVQFVEYRFEKQVVDQVTYQIYLLNCESLEKVPLSTENTAHAGSITTLAITDPLPKILCTNLY